MADPKRYTDEEIEELLNQIDDCDIYDPLTQNHYTLDYTPTQYREQDDDALPF